MYLETLLLATSNEGKIKEIRHKLSDIHANILSRNNFKNMPDPIENGNSFYENALLKAKYYYEKTGYPALADDSGLVVDALKGEPGIYSARYAGENATDKDNNEKLLKQLKGIVDRNAHFQSCVVLYINPDKIYFGEGVVSGTIIDTPQGSNGFGYDPIFFVESKGKTMAELSTEEKNSFSHRANALEDLYQKLKNLD